MIKRVRFPITYHCTSSCDVNEILCRKRALRDAILCMGWIRIVAIMFYVIMCFFVQAYSKGSVSLIIQVMIWIVVPFVLATAILLFLGALEDKQLALEMGLWLCLLVAAYNTVLGLIGAVYFIRVGTEIIHFLLATVFGFIGLSLLTVVCHDFVVVYSFKQLLDLCECPQVSSSVVSAPVCYE